MIVRIDDVNKPEEISELWRQPLLRVSLEGLEATRYLDGLEEQVTEMGWAIQRTWVEVRDDQRTARLQDAVHFCQGLVWFGEMDHEADEGCVKGPVRQRRLLAVFRLERNISRLDRVLRQREHAWRKVSGHDAVRLTGQHLCRACAVSKISRNLAPQADEWPKNPPLVTEDQP